MDLATVKKNHLVEKRNVLNELRDNNMNLQELRFFSIYLAKINARDISTRVVRFPMSDFQKIMELGRINLNYLMSVTNSLLCKVVNILEEGGYKGFQLFKQCRVNKDGHGEMFVEIDAHDEALPLMFDFKDRYFTYELWNALRLKSSNQLRMYELLKQFEKLGERVVPLNDLKALLGLDKDDHPRYNNFKVCVLDGCQEALETYTDIKFAYEPIRKKGRGREVTAIKFAISHNDNYADPLALADFIDLPNSRAGATDDSEETVFGSERLDLLAEACDNEFNEAEVQVLYNLAAAILPHRIGESIEDFDLKAYGYLKHRYDELNMRAGRAEIKSRFGYLKKMLDGAVKEVQEE
jgi:hypothetical protein